MAQVSGAHARFAPSSLDRLMTCSGSFALEAQFPEEEEGESAKEGTAAHHVMAALLQLDVMLPVGTLCPNGVEVTEEMQGGAEMFRDAVRKALKGSGWQINVERPVTCFTLHPDCWGTPDAWVWQDVRHLHIFDYKFGHLWVNEYENWQMLAYASDLVHDHMAQNPGLSRSEVRVSLHIIQPRAYGDGGPVRTWTEKVEALDPYWFRIKTVLSRVDSGDTMCVVKKSACRDCRGRHACRVLEMAAQSGIVASGNPMRLDLPTAAAALELRLLEDARDAMGARISGLQAQLEAAAKKGERFPFYAVKPSYGREKWSIPDAEVQALGELFGVDLMQTKPVTPTQARKIVPSVELLEGRTVTPSGMKLQPISNDQTRRIFSA